MCGIAGIRDGSIDDTARVEKMLAVQRHRGPDASGVVSYDDVTIGHCRLAIIDPVAASDQPFVRDHLAITFNGEIYNYVELRGELEALGHAFTTRSDTEVLLAAWHEWGEACLPRLNGMFAFAVHDRRTGDLTCVRDRLGVKPFVYAWDGRRFVFASEHKALLEVGAAARECDPSALFLFVTRGYGECDGSTYRDIQQLAPGHLAVVRAGGAPVLRRWWAHPPRDAGVSERSISSWAEQLSSTIDDAVELRLRSDVEVGAFLSGGVDSSVIACAADAAGAHLVGWAGSVDGPGAVDERPWARMVAGHLGWTLQERVFDIDDLALRFDDLLHHLDEPTAGPGAFPQLLLCEAIASSGCRVMLGGQGGDELFGGYVRHVAAWGSQSMRTGSVAGRVRGAAGLVRLALRERHRRTTTAMRVPRSAFDPGFLDLVDPRVREAHPQSPLSCTDVDALLQRDVLEYLPALLHVDDRTSMAASIETRTPLLDVRVVEAAMRMPAADLFAGPRSKEVLRCILEQRGPAAVADRRDKQGFPTPLGGWSVRPRLEQLFEQEILVGRPHQRVFTQKYLDSWRSLSSSELWTIAITQGWLARLEQPVASSG